MSEVSLILHAIAEGDPDAASQLLPLVYDELRKLAAQKLARETPGQTLQPTALVHEAYLRLVGEDEEQHWDSRGHFFAAAAEAMRRILTDKQAAELVQLRYFAGLPIREIAEILGIAPRTADRLWAFAKAWLHQEIEGG